MTVSNLTLGGPAGTTNTLALSGASLPLHLATTQPGGVALELAPNGAITVDSSTLQLEAYTHIAAVAGAATLTLNSGSVVLGNDVSLGFFLGQGEIDVNGGTLVIGGTLYAGAAGGIAMVNVAGGTLLHTNVPMLLPYTSYGELTLSAGLVKARGITMGGPGGVLEITGGTMMLAEEQVPSSQAHLLIGDAGLNNPELVSVAGTGLLTVTNAAGAGRIECVRGEFLVNGGAVVADNLLLTNGGSFSQSGGLEIVNRSLLIGNCAAGISATGTLTGGVLCVTNSTHSAVLDVRNGALILGPGGALYVDTLVLTNPCGQFVNQGVFLTARQILTLTPPKLTITLSGQTITVQWPSLPGWFLQQNPNLAN
jgi:hypothetical protein